MAFPTSPDDRWHYLISFQIDGPTVGHMAIATTIPALATNSVIHGFVRRIATSHNVSESKVAIISLSLLAAP